MRTLRFIGVAGALVIVTGAGLIMLAPVARGQTAVVRAGDEPEIRALEVFSGRGSQIGVSIRDVDEGDVKRERLPSASGAVVEEVRSDTPAEKAGFKAGDVVTAFDGERVRSARQFARLVDETPSGRHVKATVIRDGKPVELEVAPAAGSGLAFGLPREWRGQYRHPAMPGMRVDPFEFELAEPGFPFTSGRGRLGVGVQELTPELAEYFGAKQGVLVNSVEAGSPASEAGLKPGDVIAEVNGRPVENSGDLRRRLWQIDDDEITIGVVRDKKALSLKARLEQREDRKVTKPGTRA